MIVTIKSRTPNFAVETFPCRACQLIKTTNENKIRLEVLGAIIPGMKNECHGGERIRVTTTSGVLLWTAIVHPQLLDFKVALGAD
ncbi:MAG: hypothetical protein KAS32_25535 [Candidatus Peribacteraceae bacterium]|nr:hypothetical protein [Candidatus Peribacteraceae bacterium]